MSTPQRDKAFLSLTERLLEAKRRRNLPMISIEELCGLSANGQGDCGPYRQPAEGTDERIEREDRQQDYPDGSNL